MNKLTAKDILKTDNLIVGTGDQTLKEALSLLTRSHDALFVFDNKKKFIGIISPYYVIFKSNFPPETKLENCLFNPPKITLNTSIWDIAKLMVESKVYFLPVLENKKFVGVVTASRLLSAIAAAKDQKSIEILTSDRLITIKKTATLSDTYQLLKNKQISRLPVVNNSGSLVGIVTRFDIQEAFAIPKHKPRFLSRSGEKDSTLNQPLSKYYRKMVITLPQETTGKDIVNKIISHNIGSVILVDKKRKPVVIVTVHDILCAVNNSRPSKKSQNILIIPKDFIQSSQLKELTGKYFDKFTKRYSVSKMETRIENIKNAKGENHKFAVSINTSGKEQKRISKNTDYDWQKATRSALDKLDRQLREK